MKVLVIPDVHLKPQMFVRADELMHQGIAERSICLMDIADDWNQEDNIGLYRDTYDAAIQFAKANPDSLWCYGNHDISYLWYQKETGFSEMAMDTVQDKIKELRSALPSYRSIQYVHRIDNVLFSHGGLSDYFVRWNVQKTKRDNIDFVLETINCLGSLDLWMNDSPLWLRPHYSEIQMYKPRKLLQVVGHTPVEKISREKNVISCDVFSSHRDGTPIGTQEYLLLDTVSWEFQGIK